MLLKIIDENRVKILMEDQDIERYDLPFEKLNYDDPYSRAFIGDLIQKTYEETGINLFESRVMVEVVPGVARAYYILISRIKKNGEERIEFDKAELPEPQEYIFSVCSGDRLLLFNDRLKKYLPQKSALYFYNRKYYIVLSYSLSITQEEGFLLFLDQLEEYADRCEYRLDNISLLKEWGDCIFDGDVCGEFISKKS